MVMKKKGSNATSTRNALTWAEKELTLADIHPAGREACWLLEHVLQADTVLGSRAFEQMLPAETVESFYALVRKRASHYPLQYLLGSLEFAGITLAVTPDVLIPRPETEYLVERILIRVPDRTAELVCADLGTGSGCLALALSAALPQSCWHACDTSTAALKLADSNAVHNHVSDRILWYCGNWFEAYCDTQVFDMIVSNPPYVAEGEALAPELGFEPAVALYGGRDGMDAWRVIIGGLPERLAPGGFFAGEFGLHQETMLEHLARQAGFRTVGFEADLSGRMRYIFIVQN